MPEGSVDGELRELIFRFSYRFSRFEFALKEAHFLRSHTPGKRAEPDWADFVRKFEDDYQLSDAANALIQANPKQQVVSETGASLEFKNIDRGKFTSDMAYVVALARTARNNLFHGGKHDSEGWDDSARIRKLVELSATILDSSQIELV